MFPCILRDDVLQAWGESEITVKKRKLQRIVDILSDLNLSTDVFRPEWFVFSDAVSVGERKRSVHRKLQQTYPNGPEYYQQIKNEGALWNV